MHIGEDRKSETTGWLRISSVEKAATVRAGISIDSDEVVGKLENGEVVYFDSVAVCGSEGKEDCHPVQRYHVVSRKTGLVGWISQRGRFISNPYMITERCECSSMMPVFSNIRIGEVQGYNNTLVASQKDAEARLMRRIALLQEFNKLMTTTIPFVDLSLMGYSWSLATKLASCRSLIFSAVKQEIWEQALEASTAGEQALELKLSRGRAARYKDTCDTDAHHTLFAQAFRAMRALPAEAYRVKPNESLYTTLFAGEMAQDAGGPYRESFAQYTTELQSSSLPLFLRCPNGVNNVGINREKWVPNPSATSALHLELFAFLGKLMGYAIRSQNYLDLNFPSILWKQLVQQPITRDDLEGIDLSLIQTLSSIRNIEEIDVTEDLFEDVFDGNFSTVGLDGRVVELLPQGLLKRVTLSNRTEYVELVEKYRLHEFSQQANAIRSGLAQVVPATLLTLFSWDELEVFVCGNPEVDLALLKSCTDYSRCSINDKHIRNFWTVLESFSGEERSLFLRFTWGRSRLPISVDHFHQRFKIQNFSKHPADSYLPVAHTCFFSLELPHYSTLEIMASKLRYAIHNCQAIDADDTSMGRTAANLGWEDIV